MSVLGDAAVGVGFWDRLASYDDRPALLTADTALSYAELASRVRETTERLGPTRRLVLLAGANRVDAVVGYLAALSGGHPVILLPGDNPTGLAAVAAAYDPDVVLADGVLDERRPGTAHDLHPELALLLSTSGTTGSPKLVRLSAGNVAANAAAIAEYLRIRPTDVAATTLPMHYCYGLSVINSHLSVGAALALTELSVVDPCFWDLVRDRGVTTFAGVPYTFDLLDRVGFPAMQVPSLRYLTQAGGRLAPERVRRYAELGRARGWDLFVMYGQTEATARMAYLPPDLATEAPEAIGVAIPGGAFHLEPLPEAPFTGSDGQVGELVYEGPNVMLGYAETPADLARGREVHALRTGDVARLRADGLYEILGRRSRIAKVLGLRLDLDQVERVYAGLGHLVHAADGEDRLLLGVDVSARPADPETLRRAAREHLGLPPAAVQVLALTDVPRLPTGKPDHHAIRALAAAGAQAAAAPAPPPSNAGLWTQHTRYTPAGATTTPRQTRLAGALRAAYAEVLDRPDVTDADSFVGLGGDSLSYVEASIRIEGILGTLPPAWHLCTVAELVERAPLAEPAGPAPAGPTRAGPAQEDPGTAPSRSLRTLETNVLLRAAAIVAIVATHANLVVAVGGAHLLLAVAGFNLGRFHLTDRPRADRVRHLLASTARVAVPSALWIGAVALVTGDYGWANVLLLNGVFGPAEWTEPAWWYWFVEALVAILLGVTALLAVPWLDRAERRWSFGVPFVLALVGLLTRYDLVSLLPGDRIHRAHVVFWLFAIGWATVKASDTWQRVAVSALTVATVPGFFGDPAREATVAAGILLLVWLPAVRVPGWLARVTGVLASASLYVYLCHWQVYPHLEDRFPLAATLASLAAGVVLWQVASRAMPPAERAVRRSVAALRRA